MHNTGTVQLVYRSDLRVCHGYIWYAAISHSVNCRKGFIRQCVGENLHIARPRRRSVPIVIPVDDSTLFRVNHVSLIPCVTVRQRDRTRCIQAASFTASAYVRLSFGATCLLVEVFAAVPERIVIARYTLRARPAQRMATKSRTSAAPWHRAPSHYNVLFCVSAVHTKTSLLRDVYVHIRLCVCTTPPTIIHPTKRLPSLSAGWMTGNGEGTSA